MNHFLPRPFQNVAVALIAGLMVVVSACIVADEADCTSDDDCADGQRCIASGGLLVRDGICTGDETGLDAGTHDAEDAECQPESDIEFCQRHGAECGSLEALDNCDELRDVDCQSRSGFGCDYPGQICEQNTCVCPDIERADPISEICAIADVECGDIRPFELCPDWEDAPSINCGVCATGEICHEGTCICDDGYTDCSGDCVDLHNDQGHCGDCHNACPDDPPNFECDFGACVCTPDCTDAECGNDGCNGSCGFCDGCQSCDDNECVDDDSECDDGEECVDGQCECVPDCDDNQCGPDGCGGSCGSCDGCQSCTGGTCVDDNSQCTNIWLPICCNGVCSSSC